MVATVEDDVIEVGVGDCNECGGSDDLPDGECPICFGDGYLSRVVTLAEFRRLAGVAQDSDSTR